MLRKKIKSAYVVALDEVDKLKRKELSDSTYLYTTKKFNAKLVTADEELKEKSEGIAECILLKDF